MNPVFHFELPAKDMARAKAFYEKVFGWNITASYETYYLAATTAQTDSAGMSHAPGIINGALQQKDETITSLRLVVEVDNLEEAVEKALNEGATMFIPPKQLPHMKYCVIIDTEGNEVNLVEKLK